jgi:Integrase core domain
LQQFREAISCDHPCFLIRDRASIFSVEVDDQLKTSGFVLRMPARAPQANAYCERLLGTARRECLDFMIPLGEKHLSRILAAWITHYNQESKMSTEQLGTLVREEFSSELLNFTPARFSMFHSTVYV